MYNVSEAADIIGVEKVEIFEKLITHKSLLEPDIKNVDGVIYFEEQGITILKTLFYGTTQNEIQDEKSFIAEIEPTEKRVVKVRSKFERERDILYDKIDTLKNELGNLDDTIKMKDEQILFYQKKLMQDLETINKLQIILTKKE